MAEIGKVVPKPAAQAAVPAKPIADADVYHFGVPQSRLTVFNKDPNFYYYWVNDYPGRVQFAQSGGYVFVLKGDPETCAPGVAPIDSEVGSQVSTVVGVNNDGSPLKAYLMKVPMERWEAGQRILQGHNDKQDAAIQRGKTTGKEDKNFYVPKGSPISMDRD
jgi:hypothetical protein